MCVPAAGRPEPGPRHAVRLPEAQVPASDAHRRGGAGRSVSAGRGGHPQPEGQAGRVSGEAPHQGVGPLHRVSAAREHPAAGREGLQDARLHVGQPAQEQVSNNA